MRRQDCLAALDDEQGNLQSFLQARDRVTDRRLAAVQVGRGLGEAPPVDHGRQNGPLLERGSIHI